MILKVSRLELTQFAGYYFLKQMFRLAFEVAKSLEIAQETTFEYSAHIFAYNGPTKKSVEENVWQLKKISASPYRCREYTLYLETLLE